MKNCKNCGKEIEDNYEVCYGCYIKKYGRFKCKKCGKRLFSPYSLCYDCSIKEKKLREERKGKGVCLFCGKRLYDRDFPPENVMIRCDECWKDWDKEEWARYKTYETWGSASNLPCKECGSISDCQWHHEDYDKPLCKKTTYPLCIKCHNKKGRY